MSRYTDDSRDRVREAVDMVAVVSARTELRRAGVNSYFGVCPFHDERTASFHVSPDDRLYHCFGCQASGDVFKFMMETEGLDFGEALETLADRFGVQLERQSEDPAAEARSQRRRRLYALLDRAATFYARYLWDAAEAEPAREYLIARGFTRETLSEFRVGYAPSAWDRLLRASRAAAFADDQLLAVGLAQRSRNGSGKLFDRFRERIMFPSCDTRGRVLGFGARAMRDDQRPKYLNTSDGELYHKREQLFGIDLARGGAARAGRMILVEGYTDVLALHQAGLANAVGIMGTSLTDEQVAQLRRLVPVLELCLDADGAGQEAMLRAARLAAGSELELRVVALQEGSDPADLIQREGADALRERVERSVPFVVFHVQRILAGAELSSAEGRDRALTALAPVLAELPQSILRDELTRQVAGRLELSESRLAALVAGAGRGRPAPAPPAGTHGPGRVGPPAEEGRAATAPRPATAAAAGAFDRALRAERAFLSLCLALPEEGQRQLESLDPEQLLTSEPLRQAARHLNGRTRQPLSDLPDDAGLAGTVADLVARAGRMGLVGGERLEHARLILELDRVDRGIVRARGTGGAGIDALARERERVLAAIHKVVARLERVI